MNIREFVETKKRDIESIERTDAITRQLKEALEKKYMESLNKVDEKLREIASTTAELGINHLTFAVPYRDAFDNGLVVSETGCLYMDNGGRFLLHDPKLKTSGGTLLSRLAPMLSDANCVDEIERAFIENADAYFEQQKKKSNDKFKETFNELAHLEPKRKFNVSIVANIEVEADDAESAERVGMNRLKNVDCCISDYYVEELTDNVKEEENAND